MCIFVQWYFITASILIVASNCNSFHFVFIRHYSSSEIYWENESDGPFGVLPQRDIKMDSSLKDSDQSNDNHNNTLI